MTRIIQIFIVSFLSLFFVSTAFSMQPIGNPQDQIIKTIEDPNIAFINKKTTWKEIEKKLSPQYHLLYAPHYIVDFGAILVKKDDQTLFAILTDPAKQPTDKTTFSTLIFESPGITTSEGIGAGSLIADASHAYGPVELSYNPENESREFATFKNGPKNIIFRTGTADEAGIYQKGTYTTSRYKRDAKIKWMMMNLSMPSE